MAQGSSRTAPRATYPPITLAAADELAAAFSGSRARPALVLVADHLREPRPVTADGVLEDPDVEVLGAQLDELLGDGGREAVYVVAGWGAAAGFLEARDGRLGRTDRADGLSAEGFDLMEAAQAAYAGIGRLVYTETLSRWLGAGPDAALFDAVADGLALAGDQGVTEPDLVDVAWRTLIAEVAVGAQARGRRKEVRQDVAAETAWLVELLTDLGAASVADDRVQLTPLGVWLWRTDRLAAGAEVPLVGELQDAPVGQLLAVAAHYPPALAEAEIDRWVNAAGGVRAAAALAEHAVATDEPAERSLALATLDRLGAEAEPSLRTLLDDPTCRPHGLAWLQRHGADDLDALAPDDSGAALIEHLAVALTASGPSGAVDALATVGAPAAQARAIDELWRTQSPHTEAVLDGVGHAHPDKTVAKAARRALFKLRSAASR